MRLRALRVLGFLLVSALTPVPSLAEGLQDTKSTAQSAVAQFRTPDPSNPCVQTDVDVFVSRGSTKGDLGSSSGISTLVEVHQYNHCEAVALLGLSVRPTDLVFQGGNGLKSASLRGTTSATDFVSGQTFTLTIDIAWSAAGDLTRTRTHETVTVEGCSAVVRFSGSVQPATASATVSIPGRNFTPFPTDIATLSAERSGVQTRGC